MNKSADLTIEHVLDCRICVEMRSRIVSYAGTCLLISRNSSNINEERESHTFAHMCDGEGILDTKFLCEGSWIAIT